MGMTKVSCRYYRCDKLGEQRNKANSYYCPLHLDMIRKFDHIARNPNRKRVCLYPKCETILNHFNSSYFCYTHYKRVVFEMSGQNPDKVKGLDVSKVNQDKVEKVLHFKKRRVAHET